MDRYRDRNTEISRQNRQIDREIKGIYAYKVEKYRGSERRI